MIILSHCGACDRDCNDLLGEPPGECYVPTCNSGLCSYVPSISGTSCSVGSCDGAGACVPD